jgi:hypothetical protein
MIDSFFILEHGCKLDRCICINGFGGTGTNACVFLWHGSFYRLFFLVWTDTTLGMVFYYFMKFYELIRIVLIYFYSFFLVLKRYDTRYELKRTIISLEFYWYGYYTVENSVLWYGYFWVRFWEFVIWYGAPFWGVVLYRY